jgi:hypothetical protein
MIELKDIIKENLSYDWSTIYIGITIGLMGSESLGEYSIEQLGNGDESELINDLT